MEDLFTDETGIDELKESLGFLDMNIPFTNLKGKLKMAKIDIINLIGTAMYSLAVVEYKKPADAEDKNKDFIFAVRNAIAIQGYRKYAPHNDVSHTTQGRINRVEEHQKTAFQWQVDNDNAALERSYYEALDLLIKYLDENITSWKETKEYKSAHNLFLNSTKEFDAVFPIGNSRLKMLMLAPGQKRCEDKEIKSRIGKTLFDSLKANPSTNVELVDKIKEATAFYALAWAMRRYSVKLFPEGAVQGYKSDRLTTKASKPAENNEAYSVAAYFEIDAKETFIEIEQIITQLNKPADQVIAPLTFKADPNAKHLNL